jgi:hypothetical protein
LLPHSQTFVTAAKFEVSKTNALRSSENRRDNFLMIDAGTLS